MSEANPKHGEMTQEQIDKKLVRSVLRTYMATPGATMESDVFVSMVNIVSHARQEGWKAGMEEAAKMMDPYCTELPRRIRDRINQKD